MNLISQVITCAIYMHGQFRNVLKLGRDDKDDPFVAVITGDPPPIVLAD